MKASDIFDLATKIAELKSIKEAQPMRRRRPPRHIQRMPDVDITVLLHKKLEEAETLKRILDDREKANKKEDKKKDGLSTIEIMMLLIASYPIIGPAWLLMHR